LPIGITGVLTVVLGGGGALVVFSMLSLGDSDLLSVLYVCFDSSGSCTAGAGVAALDFAK
jgi:hypothetical protein